MTQDSVTKKPKSKPTEEEKPSRLKTLFVAMACIAGAATGSFYLYEDFNAKGRAGIGKPMAQVQRREAKVRRKAATSYVWTNVERDENLYLKDSLQTSGGSTASVKFNDGSVLEVGENSL